MPALTFSHERAFFPEISQVALRRGGGCFGVAVLKRMDGFEVEMRDPCPGERGYRAG
jgi:hypothetical protein